MYGYKRWKLFDFFCIRHLKYSFSARNTIQRKHQREQGSLGELSWLWHMPPTCRGTFRAMWRDLSSWLPEMSVQAAQLNHCKLLWNSSAYLGNFNWDGNIVTANIGIMLSISHFVTVLCGKILSFLFYQISVIPDVSKAASKCLNAKSRYAGILSSLVDSNADSCV